MFCFKLPIDNNQFEKVIKEWAFEMDWLFWNISITITKYKVYLIWCALNKRVNGLSSLAERDIVVPGTGTAVAPAE